MLREFYIQNLIWLKQSFCIENFPECGQLLVIFPILTGNSQIQIDILIMKLKIHWRS